MDGQQRLDDAPVPRQRVRPAVADVHPRCPACRRPVRLRADVVRLADGRDAIDADGLRLALRVHMRRCDGP